MRSKPRLEKQPGGGFLLRPERNQSSNKVSAASVRMKSNCRAKVIYPRMAKMTSITLDRENAIRLASNILALAHDTRGEGDYVITGMNMRGGPGRKQVSITKTIKKQS